MENYEKEVSLVDLNDKEKEMQLIECIINTQKDLQKAHINFEYAEKELVDFYSYQIKANQSKLDYLTKLAKSKSLENTINKYISKKYPID